MTAAAQKIAAKGNRTIAAEPAANLAPSASPDEPSMESHAAWPAISAFPLVLAVSIPLRGLRLRDLLALRPGRLIGSSWNPLAEVPLNVGTVQLASGEFDVANENISLRLTRLA